MKNLSSLLLALVGFTLWASAAPNIVENGQPKAEIVIPAEPQRLVELAAQDLQTYIRKMSGAELPIVTQPGDMPVKLYVGESPATEKLGIDTTDLKHGAFRLKSGEDYLALVGEDYQFEPKEPWARKHRDREQKQAEWEEVSGGTWGNPMGSLWRDLNKAIGTWSHSQSGSFNAVAEFLRRQGVRWYMPGELGEVVPKQETIALPNVDETVTPDSSVRAWHGAYMAFPEEMVLWDLRLGMNTGSQVLGAGMHVHGMRLVQDSEKLKEEHPEYYAIYGGQRMTEFRGTGHACFSSEGLVQETARFARAVFDHYDEPAVSLWPQDGFRQCQCEECWEMTPSENVWGFIDTVARELYKTHPDRKVTGGAYSSYRYPPETIDQFSPNVYIFVAHSRHDLTEDDGWERFQGLIQSWIDKTGPGRIIQNSNDLPPMILHPTAFARDLTYTKGLSLGDWNEVRRGTIRRGVVGWRTIGLDHLNVYTNARFLWDRDIDLEAMLSDYYQRFYGPAADAMQKAHQFAEANYTRLGRSQLPLDKQIRFRELLQLALAKADGVYAKRIQLILSEMKTIDELKQAIKEEEEAKRRPDARLAVGHEAGSAAEPPSYELVDIVDGSEPDVKTTFHVVWEEDALVFTITAHEPDMENLFVSKDIWGGDSVAVLLETPIHSYYQLEFNPDGDLFDADREYGKVQQGWSSHAKIETERGDDFWRVKVRIPVVTDPSEGALDPVNFVVGTKPTEENPWYFQVGRVRIRDGEKKAYTFMSTGKTYHDLKRFGRLEIK